MDKANKFYTIIIVLTLIVMSIGATFAYLAAEISTEDSDMAGSTSYTINLSVLPKYPNPENGPYTIIPMNNDLTEKAYIGYNGKPCIDKNSATVCYIYEIKVYEYSSGMEYVSGTINVKTSNVSNLSYKLYDEDGNIVTLATDENDESIYYNSIISEEELPLGDAISVKGKEDITLYLMIWLTDIGESQNEVDIGTFNGSVTFYSGKGGKITGKISSAIEGSYQD